MAVVVDRRARSLAWGLVVLAVALRGGAAAVEHVVGDASLGDALGEVLDVGVIFSICFPVLGALVVRRQGSHSVGWLMVAIGLLISSHNLADHWASAAHADPGSLPVGDAANWLSYWLWLPGWVLATTVLPVIFPDGQLSRRRRRLVRADYAGVVLATFAIAAVTWQLRDRYGESGPEPASVAAAYVAGVLVVGVLTLVSLGSLIARFRRSPPAQRRQIGWVVYGVAVGVVMSLMGAAPGVSGVFQYLEALAIVGGFAIAMFRYELYDIGVVVNRTLVYAALTATLAATYLTVVLALQLVLSGVTNDSGLAVAMSTLAVATVFRPARRRIQAGVDRRFFRRRYDATRTLERFGRRARDEVNVDALSAELRAAVAETVQPLHVSVWLRQR